MGTTLKTSLAVAAAFVGLFAGTSSAQDVLNANIPFSFVVGHEEYPAGRYRLTTGHPVLMIRGRDNDTGMVAMTDPAGGRDPKGDEPVLVFDRYEKTYRLTEIWNSETQGASLVTRHHHESEQPVASSTGRVLITASANDAK
jgi:hypothetical protein